MNLKGLRADVELVASAKRIACGDGHSLSFRVSAQLYIITENEKRRGRLERMTRLEVTEPRWFTGWKNRRATKTPPCACILRNNRLLVFEAEQSFDFGFVGGLGDQADVGGGDFSFAVDEPGCGHGFDCVLFR